MLFANIGRDAPLSEIEFPFTLVRIVPDGPAIESGVATEPGVAIFDPLE